MPLGTFRAKTLPAYRDILPFKLVWFDMNVPSFNSQQQKDDFGGVIVRWETFRIIYNIFLVFVCLCFTALADPANFLDPEFWMFLALGALLTNLVFFLGPAFDGYLTWYGFWTAPVAVLLFLAGTGYTTYIAVVWIGSY